MSEVGAMTDHWAILIGISFYKERPLKGCVRDVELLKDYLEKGSTPVRIVTLTATAPENSDSCHPTEKPDSWPTYDNVASCLEKTAAQAKPGDFVYIHYSGHGTQTEGTSEYSNSNQNTGDLALVLFDLAKGSRYLPGQKLASMLNNMVKKGLLVTLVLDCCFSGSVVRHHSLYDAGIRTIRYDAAIDAAYPWEPDNYPSNQVGSSLRDACIVPKWLIDPDGYSILSACAPHEEAHELTLAGGKNKHGALSFFLAYALHSLRKSGTEITLLSLYRHLCIQFHVHWPKQTPMHYGNIDLSFFGKLRSGLDTTFIPVFRTNGDARLKLAAGQAHGVCQGDEFAVYPFNSSEGVEIKTRNDSLKVMVDTARGLTSDLVGIEPLSKIDMIKTGWKARPLTFLSSWKVPIRLMATVGDQAQWISATKQRRFVALATEDVGSQLCLFNITLNERNEYEILNGCYQKITSLPAIPSDRNGSLNHVIDILEHLATFKYFEGIDNRVPKMSFEHSFKLHLGNEGRRDLGEEGIIDVKHEDVLCLTVENLGEKPLYVAIFNLGPEWQIDSLLSQQGGGGFSVVPSKDESYCGKEEIKWRMSVPESLRSKGVYHCEDVLKVFITSKPSSFAPMLLPKVSISGGHFDRLVRGDCDRVSSFLARLSAPLRGEDEIVGEEWAARNFLIRTTTEQYGTQ